MRTLRKLCAGLDFVEAYGNQDAVIHRICCDSRQIQQGDLFVAIKGYNTDGNIYIKRAIEAGAAGIVTEKLPEFNSTPVIRVKNTRTALASLAAEWYHHPQRKLTLIGITGTNGKTTTAYLIKAILQASGIPTGLMGTIEYILGDKSIPAERTTPEPTNLLRHLAEMVENGRTHAVMEVTSHALAQDRTHGLSFKTAVFTNFSHEHLDFHKTRQNYLEAKLKLFKNLDNDSVAVVNFDDAASLTILENTQAKVVTYSTKPGLASVSGRILDSQNSITALELTIGDETLTLHTALGGNFNLYNILAAAAAVVSLGIDSTAIKNGIESLKAIPGRMELLVQEPFKVYIDFAHTPESLRQALQTCRNECKGKLISVFGCGGERDKIKRPEMGKIAEELADFIVLTSDNPRSENPTEIINEIDDGIRQKSKRILIQDRKTAIVEALNRAQPDDTILISGKGHETFQEIDGERIPFDDRQVVREIFFK